MKNFSAKTITKNILELEDIFLRYFVALPKSNPRKETDRLYSQNNGSILRLHSGNLKRWDNSSAIIEHPQPLVEDRYNHVHVDKIIASDRELFNEFLENAGEPAFVMTRKRQSFESMMFNGLWLHIDENISVKTANGKHYGTREDFIEIQSNYIEEAKREDALNRLKFSLKELRVDDSQLLIQPYETLIPSFR